jgi:PAS domain S-box-containing protein
VENSSDAEQINRFREHLRVVSEAAKAFAEATTDYERLLDSVARVVSERVHDVCAVFLSGDDAGPLRTVSLHATDPEVLDQMRQTFSRTPLDPTRSPTLRAVMESGEAVLVRRLEEGPPPSEIVQEMQQRFGLHSYLVVALRAHQRSIGVLALGRFRPDSPAFDEHDRELAQNLADHASLAIQNARLYFAVQEARRAAVDAEERTRRRELTDQAARALTEAARRESEGRLQRTLDMMMEGYTVLDPDLRYVYVNDVGARHAQLPRETLIGHTPMELYPSFESTGMYGLLMRCLRERVPLRMEEELTLADGSKAYFDVNLQPTLEGGLAILSIDVTQRRRMEVTREALEEQLRQSQRMDAVGRLAGGIAHDFNNILSIILGYGETLLEDLDPRDPKRADVEEIHRAAGRAAELTKQLLMFSRQQLVEPKVLDLNEVLGGMQRMLRRILGEHIELCCLLEGGVGRIKADRGNIEQVIMNLVVNARDAMPKGGTLTVETANVTLDEAFARAHLGAEPGAYVLLAVTDTGLGMDKATRLRIFEPFFTTKEQGKGTGLGLSTVFGIVQQSRGGVWVYSEPGRGSTFKVYLPSTDAAAEFRPASIAALTQRGTETVLLVEDDESVRAVAQRMLERNGYRVIVAHDPADALRLSDELGNQVDVLMTDVVMPRMSGALLAAQLLARRPEIKVLYVSGYTDATVMEHGALGYGASFLQKPFTSDQLMRKLRGVFDAPAPAESAGTAGSSVA